MPAATHSKKSNASIHFLLGEERVSIALQVSAELAAEWNHAIRDRRRWIGSEGAAKRQAARLEVALERMCGGAAPLKTLRDGLGKALTAEVVGAAPADGGLLAWTLVPWEYMLSTLAWTTRDPSLPSLSVLRWLEGIDRATPGRTPVERVLFVSAAPGGIGDAYPPPAFDAERDLVHSGLDPRGRFVWLHDPTIGQLREAIRSNAPDAIHITAVDVRQGRALLSQAGGRRIEQDPAAADGADDGLYLADDEGRPAEVSASDIGGAVSLAKRNLRLVSFNLYNSAGRLAPAVLTARAAAAIGFQDEVDDRLAESFFGELYLLWRHRGVRLEEAFESARHGLSARKNPHLQGSGVVLCGARPWKYDATRERRHAVGSIVDAFRTAGRAARRTPHVSALAIVNPAAAAIDRARKHALAESLPARKADPAATAPPPAQSGLTLRVEPMARLNYSMLHNRRSFFRVLAIHRPVGTPDEKVQVEVTLNAGPGETCTWRRSITLRDAVHDLADEIQLPLISALWRGLRESVHTTLSVSVARSGAQPEEQTVDVTLQTLDEWMDTDADRIWLPSFVLPRDQAVVEVVRCGQRHLMTLADDRGAGFDGYQCRDAADKDSWKGIDLQARALWYALVHDHPLAYINPPPSFTDLSQRLRSPSEIVAGGRGTCIDLALLYAACLEFVDIHPTIVLLKGHAFAAYWRDADRYDEFVLAAGGGEGSKGRQTQVGQQVGWSLGPTHYPELMRHVNAGSLVSVETTTLTNTGSFTEALTKGRKNLFDPDDPSKGEREFDSMLDIGLARREGVTPLPAGGG